MNDSIWKTIRENAELKKENAELQLKIVNCNSENAKLKAEIDILIRKKETLRDEVCELQAEVERLKDTPKKFAKFLIDKSEKGIIYTMDLPDYVQEFLEKKV